MQQQIQMQLTTASNQLQYYTNFFYYSKYFPECLGKQYTMVVQYENMPKKLFLA